MEKKKYFITGITGFVGSALSQILHNDGHEIHALTRSSAGREADILDAVTKDCYDSIKFHYGDLLDYQSLEKIFLKEKYDGCFHLAAQSHPPTGFSDPIGTLQTNVIGSANLFRVIELNNKDCRICVVSTSEYYGNGGRGGQLLNESDKASAANPYSASKIAMDYYFQERLANGFNKGFITRSFSHTGKRRGKTFSISSDAYQIAGFILDAEKRKKEGLEEITYELKVGNLKTVRAVCDVVDIADGYYRLMLSEKSEGKAFNLCAFKAHQMEFYTDILIGISGLKINKVVDEKLYRPIDIAYQNGNTALIKKTIGWEPKIKIEDTLTDLLEYWVTKLSVAVE